MILLYLITLLVFILYHYLRTSDHFTVIGIFRFISFNRVRILYLPLIILCGTITFAYYDLQGLLIFIATFLITRWLVGFYFFRTAYNRELNYLLQDNSIKGPLGSLKYDERGRLAEDLAEEKVWQIISNNIGSDQTYRKKQIKKTRKERSASAKSSGDEKRIESNTAKIEIIRLGYKLINNIEINDDDIEKLPLKELKRYYKAGLNQL